MKNAASHEMLYRCAWCQDRANLEACATVMNVSHGLCDRCYAALLADLRLTLQPPDLEIREA